MLFPIPIWGIIISYINDQETVLALLLTSKAINQLVYTYLWYFPNRRGLSVEQFAEIVKKFKGVKRIRYLVGPITKLIRYFGQVDEIRYTGDLEEIPCIADKLRETEIIMHCERGQCILRRDYLYLPSVMLHGVTNPLLPLATGRDFETLYIIGWMDWCALDDYKPIEVVHIGNELFYDKDRTLRPIEYEPIDLIRRYLQQWYIVAGFRLKEYPHLQIPAAEAMSRLLRGEFPNITKPFIFGIPVFLADLPKLQEYIPYLREVHVIVTGQFIIPAIFGCQIKIFHYLKKTRI